MSAFRLLARLPFILLTSTSLLILGQTYLEAVAPWPPLIPICLHNLFTRSAITDSRPFFLHHNIAVADIPMSNPTYRSFSPDGYHLSRRLTDTKKKLVGILETFFHSLFNDKPNKTFSACSAHYIPYILSPGTYSATIPPIPPIR